MKNLNKVLCRALLLGGGMLALSACAYDDDYAYGYGGYGGGYGYGAGYYDDGCYGPYAGAYCGYPVFSGGVFIGGRSYRGLHYRQGRGGREFWHRGGWHRADGVRGGRGGVRGRAATRG